MKPFAIADDLTGALETGAVFREHGWRAVVPLQPAGLSFATDMLPVVTTESRNLPSDEAAAAVRLAVRSGATAGATLVFKKADSTLRGPIAAELRAIAEEMKPPLIVFCPANPPAGRIVRDGQLFVHGVPLADSEFNRDPLSPSITSRLADLFSGQGLYSEQLRGEPTTWAARLRELTAQKVTTVITCDAENQSELAQLVLTVKRTVPGAIFSGSAALAAAVAQTMARPGSPTENNAASYNSLLVICGSRHPASHRQLDHLARHHGVPLWDLPAGIAPDEPTCRAVQDALSGHGFAAVRIGLHDAADLETARRVQKCAAAVADILLRDISHGLVFVTGGETAWSVSRALSGVRLEIQRKVTTGTVLSLLHRGAEHRPLAVVTKPGGYGGVTELDDVLALIQVK